MIGDAIIVLIFWGLFFDWLAYHFFIKDDLEKQKDAIFTASFFLVGMTVVYWLILF